MKGFVAIIVALILTLGLLGSSVDAKPRKPHPTPRPTPTATIRPTPSPTAIPTPTPVPTPTATPRITPNPTPTPIPTVVPTPTITPLPTPTSPTDHWAGIPFGSRPLSNPINNQWSSADIEISNLTFNRAGTYGTDLAAAIRVEGCHNLYIHDVDFVDINWHAIDVLSCTGTIRIEWVRYRNVTRNFIQFDKSNVSGYIANTKGIGGKTEDIISMYQSGGKSATDPFYIQDNAFEGVDWDSGSGSGLMLADNTSTSGHIIARRNTLLNPGQVGIGISMGIDVHVIDNIIYGAQRPLSNVGIYTPYVSGSPNPGGHEVARNRVFWINSNGTPNPYWNGGASGTISGESTNVWQDTTINPSSLHVIL